ncbi:UDP-glucose 4-epimerase GalE [Gulosibacter sp. 10]|uniref:UDP-glucose 4-epimerase GalE n=1 Tax=Gulosibacter sp. 10 TaxID=1255570 RepID=UPI00097EF615|nr:UDP-glucose 4-epimerase GalE [Gulosibacter sp. 10]SJM59788.1 UDP-glucose 4-epimerase [Gulosibacter sp. 10]
MRLLVTGGAGYIGAHFVALAVERGFSEIIVVDDLSTGLRRRVPAEAALHEFDLAADDSVPRLASLLQDARTQAVVHFAAKKVVSDSVSFPEEYFRTNIGATLNVLEAMREAGVPHLVFSSSAAVYGEPDSRVVYESEPCQPINPYGQSKYVSELSLANASRAWGLKATVLRYFNVAGARNSLLADTTTTNLMPAIRDGITHSRVVSIFGDDYDTPDGTCIRDYVHVEDLVEAHLVALERLSSEQDAGTRAYNVGTGSGSSVLEVVESFNRIPGIQVPYQYQDRRPGDPAALIANVDKIESELGWRARFTTNDLVASVVEFPPLHVEEAVEP